jgi:hypothetical protein
VGQERNVVVAKVDRVTPPVRAASVPVVVSTPVAKPVAVTTPKAPVRSSWGYGAARKITRAPATREEALALSRAASDAVARFLLERGATPVDAQDPVEATVTAIRARGYSVVRSEDGWLIDSRIVVAGAADLVAFAEARSISNPALARAAE